MKILNISFCKFELMTPGSAVGLATKTGTFDVGNINSAKSQS